MIVTALITHTYAENISCLKEVAILFFYQYSISITKKDLSLMLLFCWRPWGEAGTPSLLLQDFRTQKQEELELKHVKELEDFDTNSSMGSSGSNTLSLKHRSTSSISTVSNSSTSSTRSTENNGTVVQQQTNDERLQVSAGPLRV